MSYGVEYRAEFTDLRTKQLRRSNLITGWTNEPSSPYDTFTALGEDIASAITDGSAYALCYSDQFSVNVGDTIIVTFNLTLNSGSAPYSVHIRNDAGVKSNEEAAIAGVNTIMLTATETISDARIGIVNDVNAANWEASDFEVLYQQTHDWRIDVLTDGYSGSIKEMTLAGDPLNISYLSPSEELLYPPIKGSMAQFSVRSPNHFQYLDLVAAADFEHPVNIYQDDVLRWSGWITPGNYSEPYDSENYRVTIACTDGLGMLKFVDYLDGEEYYNGRKTEAQVLIDLLDKIYITSFKEFINIYDDEMDSDEEDSPLDQTYIDVDIFRDMNCYEVLEYLLIKWNAIVRQKNGEIYIYRPIELKDATAYGRHFTSSTSKTAITLSPAQQISRKTSPTDFVGVNGGTLMIEPAAKKIVYRFDYGSRESWLENWDLSVNTFKDNQFESWSNGGAMAARPISEYVPGEDNGVALPAGSALTSVTPIPYNTANNFYQEFAANVKAAPDGLVLEIDYGIFNAGVSIVSGLKYFYRIQQGGYTLKQGSIDDQLVWENVTTNYMNDNIGDVSPGWTGWTTIRKRIDGVPTTGVIKVILYSTNYGDDCIMAFRDVRFLAASAEAGRYLSPAFIARQSRSKTSSISNLFKITSFVKRTERDYSVENNILRGETLEFDHIMGDVKNSGIVNAMEQFAGALTVGSPLEITDLWSTRGASEETDLLSITSAEMAKQYSRPKQMLNIPVYDLSEGAIEMIGNFQDPLNQEDGDNRIFIPNSAEFNVYERLWNINMIELVVKDPPNIDVHIDVFPEIRLEGMNAIAEVVSTPPSVACNSVGTISDGLEFDRMSVAINYTNSGGAGSAAVNWRIKDSGGSVVDSGNITTNFPSGTGNKALTGITYPAAGTDYTFEAKMSTEGFYQVSNTFDVT